MSMYGLIFSHIKYLGSLSPLTSYIDFQQKKKIISCPVEQVWDTYF